MDSFVVVGAGGIGYHLVEPLARFLNHLDRPYNITIIDGDTVENSNLSRQHEAGAVGRNKAEILAEVVNNRIRPKFPIKDLPHFISPTTLSMPQMKAAISDGTTVFVCVDNNASRVFIEGLISMLPNGIMVSGGNDLLKGQAQIYVRKNGKDLTPKPSEVNPEILELDQFPDEIGCDELVVSEPQLIFTNNTVACIMLNLWYSYWKDSLDNTPKAELINEVCTNVMRASASPFVRKSLKPV